MAVEQAGTVFFPAFHWVQTVQRCYTECSEVFSALTEAGMGVCWREGKGHLRWDCWSLFFGFHFTSQEHFCCGRNLGNSEWQSSPAHCTSERSQSPLLVTCPRAGVRWREKQDQPQWKPGPVPGVFAQFLYSGNVESLVTAAVPEGGTPWQHLQRICSRASMESEESGQKNYVSIEWVPVLGCRSQLSQL